MQRSTRLHFLAVAIAAAGFCVFAVAVWMSRETPASGALALIGLSVIFGGVLSGFGFGPLGRARERALADERAARHGTGT